MENMCGPCMESTKQVIGFKEYGNGEGDVIYGCRNYLCAKRKELEKMNELQQVPASDILAEKSRCIDINALKDMRKGYGLTIFKAAELLEVTSSEYCNYELGKSQMPKQLYEKAMSEFQKAIHI